MEGAGPRDGSLLTPNRYNISHQIYMETTDYLDPMLWCSSTSCGLHGRGREFDFVDLPKIFGKAHHSRSFGEGHAAASALTTCPLLIGPP